MERKGDLRDGEDGLIGGKLQASLRFLPPLTFLNTLLIVFPAQRPFKTVTGFCSRLIVVPVNNLHPDNDLQVSLLCYLCIRKKYNITLTVELFLIMTFHALSLFFRSWMYISAGCFARGLPCWCGLVTWILWMLLKISQSIPSMQHALLIT